ncbi:nucleoside triphosphate pyrophosphatase [Saxibacter everestensis]|uniref:Nucleoside triphosphate pyrophosphatase n=1 Tax=Saxibacter everestensis TaxID=2909229 RepID=A0ABY8QNZ4_9MICO|nr:nucleoside triphosphate pyrophosphatase [Brevibacteriaceae bacterium ZFBP1038]
MPSLILASASPSRLSTLRSAGIDPTVIVSDIDEEAVVDRYQVTAGDQVSLLLARVKAEAVADAIDSSDYAADTYLLGCDSVLDIDGVSYGKPLTRERAREQWMVMRGRSATLFSGHWLINMSTGASVGASSATTIHLADIADDEVEAYLETDEPLHVAGALTIDGFGGAYVSGIEGDHHGVIGLSLPLLRQLFGRLGVRWHTLWNVRPDQGSGR